MHFSFAPNPTFQGPTKLHSIGGGIRNVIIKNRYVQLWNRKKHRPSGKEKTLPVLGLVLEQNLKIPYILVQGVHPEHKNERLE